MKNANNWSYSHYLPLHERERAQSPYICRIAPHFDGFDFDFMDVISSAEYRLIWRERDSNETHTVDLNTTSGSISGLTPDKDYAFRVERDDGISSTERLVRTGKVPGTVINYLHPEDREYAFSGRYLCSPSLIRLENGDLLASMDAFVGGGPQNLTLIYVSHDDGKTWSHLSEIFPCFWGEMFLLNGALYMLGCSTEYGDLLIGRSDDGGKTWTPPTVILRGAGHFSVCGWHRAPMRVLVKDGRVMTDVQYGARILGSRAEIEPGKMRTGQLDPYDWTKLSEAMQHYSDMNVSFMFSARDVEDLRMEVQRKIDGEGLDMLVIDYLQLLQTRRRFEKDYLRVGYISKAIKDMTTDFNIPIIALAQVGRSSARTMPDLSELRGSGDIEQDADNVIFMHRPEDASDESILSGDGGMIAALEAEGKQYIVLEIAKQRQGQTGRTAVVFDPARMRYTGIAR
jgi:hypothetical protein